MAPHMEDATDTVNRVNVVQIDEAVLDKMPVHTTDMAREATRKEHHMSLWQGIKLYPKALGFSLVVSACIIMGGYDLLLLNGFYAFLAFRRKYGVLGSDGTYQVPAAWQAGLTNGASVGEILGLFLNGIVSER